MSTVEAIFHKKKESMHIIKYKTQVEINWKYRIIKSQQNKYKYLHLDILLDNMSIK